MHFRPNLNSNERLTCAIVCEYGNENVIKIGYQKLEKVDKVKFLGIIIDDHNKMSKSVRMHFRPNLNAYERLTCAIVCEYGNENVIKIG